MKKQLKENQLDTLRHSTAHILAAAVLEKFPKVKFGIGPTIENGFYYDFALPAEALAKAGLEEIEKRMRELIKKDLKFKKEIISSSEAKKIFKNQPYKLELIKEIQKSKKLISIYKTGDDFKTPKSYILNSKFFIDLCAGPHIKSTKEINPDSFKLTKIAGAYWKGDEKNPMLTRIYGAAFNNKKELDNYLKLQEEAEKRDHRKIGKTLHLFSLNEEAGQGLVLWHPKGTILREIIENFWKEEHKKRDYQLVTTPHLYVSDLWKTSGHYTWYKENMMITKIEDREYAVKPMNCVGVVLMYQENIHSYRELPLRLAELGTVYRAELSGTLHGLLKPRGFTQDDAHIICTKQQMLDELVKVVDFVFYLYKIFGFDDFHIELSTRPKKSVGSDEIWKKATSALKKALEIKRVNYKLNPGDGAFYGPKIDFHIKDAIGRSWQCGTIQLDFNLPERFKMDYIDEKGKKQQPVMIHRTILGSIERFIGILIEHFAGALPLWLSPVQVEIINVGAAHRQYAEQICQQLTTNNIRTQLSDENLTVSKRIREAEIQKIPYILVVGDKEIRNKTVNVRHYRRGLEGEVKIEKLIEKINKEASERAI
jgi:threonyl-tRNA synthetase